MFAFDWTAVKIAHCWNWMKPGIDGLCNRKKKTIYCLHLREACENLWGLTEGEACELISSNNKFIGSTNLLHYSLLWLNSAILPSPSNISPANQESIYICLKIYATTLLSLPFEGEHSKHSCKGGREKLACLKYLTFWSDLIADSTTREDILPGNNPHYFNHCFNHYLSLLNTLL